MSSSRAPRPARASSRSSTSSSRPRPTRGRATTTRSRCGGATSARRPARTRRAASGRHPRRRTRRRRRTGRSPSADPLEGYFSEFLFALYDMDDCVPPEVKEFYASSEVEPRAAQPEQTASESTKEAQGDGTGDGAYLQSSLFDIFSAGYEDGGVVEPPKASPPPPEETVVVVPSHSRVMGLAVVVGQTDQYVVKHAHHITVKEANQALSEYDVDEALRRDAGAPLNSVLLQETSLQMAEGHRTTLLALVGQGGGAACLSMLTSTLEGILSTTAAKKGTLAAGTDFFYKAEVSLFHIQDEQRVVDLYNPSKGSFPIVGISNPVVGRWLDGLQLREVSAARDAAAALAPFQGWLHNKKPTADEEEETLGMLVLLRQVQGGGDAKLVYLSSLLALVSRSGERMQQMCIRPETLAPSMRGLVRRIGQGTYTVAAAVLAKETPNDQQLLTHCRDLSAIQNDSIQSGNLDRYIKFAKTDLDQVEAAATGRDDDTVAMRRSMFAQMEQFLVLAERVGLRNTLQLAKKMSELQQHASAANQHAAELRRLRRHLVLFDASYCHYYFHNVRFLNVFSSFMEKAKKRFGNELFPDLMGMDNNCNNNYSNNNNMSAVNYEERNQIWLAYSLSQKYILTQLTTRYQDAAGERSDGREPSVADCFVKLLDGTREADDGRRRALLPSPSGFGGDDDDDECDSEGDTPTKDAKKKRAWLLCQSRQGAQA
ncbi:hypothetical protein STCU_11578 [Strigomonas culicis]|uniref:Uncharacterized protein n=1 Tax=Strigomonas culicis TaxID=28005 RepID=S9UMZ7_9TRYP|nr:hypothetical protein STCU_11578 [Strigomonas culicis]|eukprot:EPY16056.1 hypothetical protein STCU_11578 [Strigomonas culicis]